MPITFDALTTTASKDAAAYFIRYIHNPLVNPTHGFTVRDDGKRVIAKDLPLQQLYDFICDYQLLHPTGRVFIENYPNGQAYLPNGLSLNNQAGLIAIAIKTAAGA